MAKGWRRFFGESKMSDDDWNDRAERVAKDSLNMVPLEKSVCDDSGVPTYGTYNDDFSEEEHRRANYLLDEDPDYGEQQTHGIKALKAWQDSNAKD